MIQLNEDIIDIKWQQLQITLIIEQKSEDLEISIKTREEMI